MHYQTMLSSLISTMKFTGIITYQKFAKTFGNKSMFGQKDLHVKYTVHYQTRPGDRIGIGCLEGNDS